MVILATSAVSSHVIQKKTPPCVYFLYHTKRGAVHSQNSLECAYVALQVSYPKDQGRCKTGCDLHFFCGKAAICIYI
jgi:hypothetical protein